MPGSRLEVVLNPSNKLYIKCSIDGGILIVPPSMLHLIQLKVTDLKYKCNCLDANTFLGLLRIHLTLEVNKSILCVVTIWGQLTSNTFLMKGSRIPIYPFNLNYPESENHTEQKTHSKKYAILKFVE